MKVFMTQALEPEGVAMRSSCRESLLLTGSFWSGTPK